MMKINKWGKLTAQRYKHYTAKYLTYKKLSKFLVKIADIKKEMIVIDLACGTGITTREILKKVKKSGMVIGVDSSIEMLDVARENIKRKNTFFIHSSAEEAYKVIEKRADLILCNSGFFVMDMIKTLKSIEKVLKENGRFIFNIPDEQYNLSKNSRKSLLSSTILKTIRKFIFDTTIQPHELPKRLKNNLSFPIILKLTMQKLVVEKYRMKPKKEKELNILDVKKVSKILKKNFFEISYYKKFELKKTPREYYEFLKIPLMTKEILPGLEYLERMKILDRAYKLVDKPNKFIDKWIYFVTKKLGPSKIFLPICLLLFL